MNIDFSKAPKGATHYYGAEWYKETPEVVYLWVRPRWVPVGNSIAESAKQLHRIPTTDPVNSPGHYTTGSIECIEAIKASMMPEAFLGYLKGNVLKYLWRFEKKANPVEDLKKAQWYLERLIKEQGDE